MSDQELKEFEQALQKVRQEHAASPEAALDFLVRAGILNEEGELAEPYR